MSRDLSDETFPGGSLLIGFDELSDEISVSPELPKRHQQAEYQQRPHSKKKEPLSGKATGESDRRSDDGNGMVVSGSSNSSSGLSSLSTEGDTRSASSERDTSRDRTKAPKEEDSFDRSAIGGGVPLNDRSKYRQMRSLDNLLDNRQPGSGSERLKTPLTQNRKKGGDPVPADSGRSGGSNWSSAQYHRHRHKYGHVQSKVKQQIDQLKPANQDRRTFVRHKSMPETYDDQPQVQAVPLVEKDTSVETLRTLLRETKLQVSSLEQQLALRDLYQSNLFSEMAALKYKNSALRLENDKLVEQERFRDQQRQLLRQTETVCCYGSQSSLHKVHATSTVASQTSPAGLAEHDHEPASAGPTEQDRRRAASSPADLSSAGLRRNSDPSASGIAAIGTTHGHSDSPILGEFSPDYEELIPTIERSDVGSTSYRRDLRRVRPEEDHSDAGCTLDRSTSSLGCRDCRRKRNKRKRKTRRHKLASLFCIRRHDESV
ncbi:uncharacterized protein LOC131214827 [Anopheles bellator]|uniref:uncharacterized protein LOC131214827 n=1 Tax=Anopheles bellator TaxID=139047 RepID=UPI002647C576|nr:uncharacterized protein LOC131214827 [Anopheles bellator]